MAVWALTLAAAHAGACTAGKQRAIGSRSWPIRTLSVHGAPAGICEAAWTLIDMSIRTCDDPTMSPKQKRTYNLAPRTVRAVRELADEYHAAATQDGVIELAVDELQRRLRETAEARIWEAAAGDPGFTGEAGEVEKAYGSADSETWPA